MPVPNYDEAMARKMYQNLMDYQAQNYAAQNATIPPSAGFAAALRAAQNAPTSPQEGFAAAQNAANIQNQFQGYAQGMNELAPIQQNPQQNAANMNQAMRQYQNLLNQGAANYQAAMQQPLSPPMGGNAPTKRKSSTSFRTPPIQAF